MIEKRKRSSKAEQIEIENKVCELYNYGYSIESIAILLSKRTNEIKLHLFNAIKDEKISKRKTSKWIIRGKKIANLVPVDDIAEYYDASLGDDGIITIEKYIFNNI